MHYLKKEQRMRIKVVQADRIPACPQGRKTGVYSNHCVPF